METRERSDAERLSPLEYHGAPSLVAGPGPILLAANTQLFAKDSPKK
jgi:hypothetical protein